MADAGIIQEFLVSIGFKTDLASFNIAKKSLNDIDTVVNKIHGSLVQAGQALNALVANPNVLKTVQALNSGFKELTGNIDASTKSAADFSGTMDKNVDKSVRGFQDSLRRTRHEQEATRGGLLDIAKVAGLTFAAFAVQLRQITKEYGELYYVSQRTGVSVNSIKDAGAGFEQIGLKGEEAIAVISQMSETFDRSRGWAV